MAKELFIPKLGQTVEEVRLVRWMVEDGARVDQGQEVLEVETDKAIFAVESPAKGYLHKGPFAEDTVLPVLTVVAIVGRQDEQFPAPGAAVEAAAPAQPADSAPAAQSESSAPAQAQTAEAGRVFASPRARKLAAEEGVDLSKVTPTGGGGARVAERDVVAYLQSAPRATPIAERMAAEAGIDLRTIKGTGANGAITKEDVQQAIAQRAEALKGKAAEEVVAPAAVQAPPPPVAPAPPSAPAPQGDVLERVPLKGVRAVIADRMATSTRTVARVTLVMDVDATEFVAVRERLKARFAGEWGFAPGYNDMLVMVVARALRKFPYMNARMTSDAIEYLARIDVGMAADTDRGLTVPVVRNADQKSLRQIGVELRELVDRARKGRSLPDDFGGTFTITSLGPLDVDAFTPVINYPEAAILGVGRIAAKAVVLNDQIVARKMMTLSLAFDHRITDGAPAARFLKYVKELIEEPFLLLAE